LLTFFFLEGVGMLFSLIIFISGALFASRIHFEAVESRQLLTSAQMTKIGTVTFSLLMMVIIIGAPLSPLTLWFLVSGSNLLLVLSLMVLKFHRARAFRYAFGNCLSLIILKMKSGRSFRVSLSQVISETAVEHQQRLREIYDHVVFLQQSRLDLTSEFVSLIITEFRLVDQNPHLGLRRLQNFRDRLKLEDEFRHKSGQVLAQIRAQSVLMAGLYFAILLFVAIQFDLRQHVNLIAISMSLFVIGLSWIWVGGRKIRWRV